jgi:hypothetical protein
VAFVIVLLLLALLFGVLGFAVKGLVWLLIIAAVCVIAALLVGRARGTRSAGV